MGFFRKKDAPLIPPVAPTGGQQAAARDPYARPGGANGNGNGYGGGPGGNPGARDPYAAPSGGRADPYAAVQKARALGTDPNNPYGIKSDANPDNDAARNELFGGMGGGQAQARTAQVSRKYGYDGREQEEDFDEDEEIEGIKTQLRETKMDSLASSRNALRIAREAEENARGTISRLADQSESLANSERHLDMAKANSGRASDKAEELRKLNRSIFRPVVVWNKDAKRRAEDQKIADRHNMERDDRLSAMQDVQETRRHLNSAASAGQYGRDPMAPGARASRAEARRKFQFDPTASDDELEDELDDNLDETLDVSKRLNSLAKAMGGEVERQNQRIGRITDKTDRLETKVRQNTSRLDAIR